MTTAFKQRIVGAIFILSLGVILIPLILDKPNAISEQEKEMLSHVIPDTPALPDVSEVSKIHYVFNDVPPPSPTPAPVEPAPAPEPQKPAPILIPSDLAAIDVHTPPTPIPPEIATTTPPAAPSKGHAQASATLAEASAAEWTIQLGAFSSEQNAKALVQKLSQGGFNPYLRQMTHDSLVRVYVSPGIPREQAVDLAAKLDTEYGLKGIVVRYFQK